MANPQPTDAHIRIAHSISEEIMMRDFTKRQRSILDLVFRLSWGCGKKSAIIPRQKDFEVVGIGESKIRQELNWLVSANVLSWNKETNELSFLKDFDRWSVSLVPGYNRIRFNELLHKNLTYQNGKKLTETESQETCQNSKFLTETVRKNLPKRKDHIDANCTAPTDRSMSKESNKESKSIYNLVIDFLNQTTGQHYKPSSKKTRDLIDARLNEKFKLEDFQKVIKNKAFEWMGTDFEKYLRPETLFGNKFESYLNQKPKSKNKQESIYNDLSNYVL